MMNYSENNDQNDESGAVKAEEVPIDIDQIGLLKHRHGEDESVEGSDAVSDSASIVLGLGHQLQAGRIACNLSIGDVSRQLRWSVKQVEAIEREDFAKLPTGTFLRGFVRNYASLVKLDPKPMLQSLPSPSTSTTTILSPIYQPKKTTFSPAWTRSQQSYGTGKKQSSLIKFVLLILGGLIVYSIYQSVSWGWLPFISSESDNSKSTEMIDGQPAMELQLPVLPANSSDNQSQMMQPGQTIGTDGSLQQKHFSSVVSLSAAIASSKPALGGQGSLRFRFASESWVEVKDRSNTIVFKQVNAGGTEQVVRGDRPLTLVIGNAARVDLTYNEREIDLSPYTSVNEGIARLTLE